MNKILQVIKTPQESVNDDSVIIVEILVKNGDKVSSGDKLAEIETSKANIEIHSDENGFVKSFFKENQEVLIGETLFEIYSKKISSNEEARIKPIENDKLNKNEQQFSKNFNTKFSKEAEKLILKNKINKDEFKSYEYVSTDQILTYLNIDKTSSSNSIKKNKKELLTLEKEFISSEKKLEKKKLNEIKYLSNVNASGLVSRLTIFINASIEEIAESQNFITSTPLPLIAYEVSRLLLKYPNLNSFYFLEKSIKHSNVNIGVAFDNGQNGLKVAAIKQTDLLDLNSIEENISNLSQKYNENKLSVEEISSSSFTITDLFSTGVTNFHPLVNINNSVILGICGINKGGFNIELSFDHRISNGLEVSKFLNDLKSRLEFHYNSDTRNPSQNDLNNCDICLRDINDDFEGNIKFIKILNSKNESIICSNCLNGW
jgi:pyruvate/2-oxoglutarate dehydrogenase complex dihydrolipoamide acyltransferase (E2) component